MLEGVILAGGRGERFWPLSRRARPKQLLRLLGESSLLRGTWERLRVRLAPQAIRIVASEDLEAAIREDLPELGPEGFVREPVGRNTATACAVAAALARREDRDPLQLVVPADHWIPHAEAFWRSVDRAIPVASGVDAPLVNFGIPILRAETGYGYIERGSARSESAGAYRTKRFHEKPDAATAARYAQAGSFYWNSGIFLWRASALLAELERHLPTLWEALRPLREVRGGDPPLEEVFRGAPPISIDHGVLERSERVAVVEAGFEWNDLGNWSSWAAQSAGDEEGNVRKGLVATVDSQGCVIYADDGLVATLGVRDLVVVRAGDVTLVIDRQRCQDVRRLLEVLRQRPDLKPYL